jgi:hypothetical protein
MFIHPSAPNVAMQHLAPTDESSLLIAFQNN